MMTPYRQQAQLNIVWIYPDNPDIDYYHNLQTLLAQELILVVRYKSEFILTIPRYLFWKLVCSKIEIKQ